MRSDPRVREVTARLLLAFGLSLAPQGASGDPAKDFAKMIQPHPPQNQQWMHMNYYAPPSGETPPFSGYFKVYSQEGPAEGMGTLHIVDGGIDDPPRISWLELSGKRYFADATDSIRLWDIRGLPSGSNWVFALAEGGINALAYHPADLPEYFSRAPLDSAAKAGQAGWSRLDTLWYTFPKTAQLEKGNGDPAMAIRIANAGRHRKGGKEYQDLLDNADYLCKVKRYAEADSLLGLAQEWDPAYPRLHSHIGECLERRDQIPAALEAYRAANLYAGTDADFRKQMEKKIRQLERKSPR